MKSQFTLYSAEGTKLNGVLQSPAGDCKAVIALIHGMGEHAMRYAHVAAFFAQNDFAVVAIDLRGHGNSGGKRGHTPSYEVLMNDLELLINKAKELFPDVPVFMYGHSMGGNLTLNYLIRKQPKIAGAIVTGPYLKLAFEPPAWKVALGKITAGLIPTLTQPTGLETAAISRDLEVVNTYENDPLVHDKITSSFFVHVHFAGPYAIENAKKITVPLLLMHGMDDRLTSPKGTQEFAKNAGENVELKLWDGLYHEIHNEPEKEDVLQYELNWLLKVLDA